MKYRKKVYEEFIKKGWEAVNIIHPDAVVSKDAKEWVLCLGAMVDGKSINIFDFISEVEEVKEDIDE